MEVPCVWFSLTTTPLRTRDSNRPSEVHMDYLNELDNQCTWTQVTASVLIFTHLVTVELGSRLRVKPPASAEFRRAALGHHDRGWGCTSLLGHVGG